MSAAQRAERAVRKAEAIDKRQEILLQLAKIAHTHETESVRATATEFGKALAAAIDLKITGKRQTLWQNFMAELNKFLKQNS